MNQKPNISVSNYAATKKHLCPKCTEPLKALTVGNAVDSSASGRSNRMKPVGANLYGTEKSYRTEYQCSACRMRYTADDLKKIEDANKKLK